MKLFSTLIILLNFLLPTLATAACGHQGHDSYKQEKASEERKTHCHESQKEANEESNTSCLFCQSEICTSSVDEATLWKPIDVKKVEEEKGFSSYVSFESSLFVERNHSSRAPPLIYHWNLFLLFLDNLHSFLSVFLH